MPDSMMIAASGVMLKVIGSSSDIAATGPMPGSTPISVPMNTPAKQNNRFIGCMATPRPSQRLLKTSMGQSARNRVPLGSWVPSQATNTAQAPKVVSTAPRIEARQLCGSTVLNSTSNSTKVATMKPIYSTTVV